MKNFFTRFLAIALFLTVPSLTLAAGLTSAQISAILGILSGFNVPQSVIASVAIDLEGSASINPPTTTASTTATTTPLTRPDTTGSPYTSGSLGYDLSFSTYNYPSTVGFTVVGVTAGKAYTNNQRMNSEYSFGQIGSTRPTLYLNLNAPYGSTATSANMSAPHQCDTLFGATTTSASAGGTYPEPTTCASYNYGYNAAKMAFAYATGASISSPLWWLDIEEANSWSANAAVNDAVIQGAIDYLNTQNIRVGIYSVPYMWHNIAGAGFAPTQSLSGQSATTPTWFPIGISTEVNALNACLNNNPLISGSPVWIIQYEANSTAVDQNIAC